PLARMTGRVAQALELLEVGELAHVDLVGEVPPDRLLERLAGLEVAAGERPGAREWILRPAPGEHLQPLVADLQDDGEGGVGRSWPGRLVHRLSTQSRKLPCPPDNPLASLSSAAVSPVSTRRSAPRSRRTSCSSRRARSSRRRASSLRAASPPRWGRTTTRRST